MIRDFVVDVGEGQEEDRTIFPGRKGCKDIGSLEFPCECVELLADVFWRQLLGLAGLRLLALLAHGWCAMLPIGLQAANSTASCKLLKEDVCSRRGGETAEMRGRWI